MLTSGSCFVGVGDTSEAREINLLSPKDIEVKMYAVISNTFLLTAKLMRNRRLISDYVRIMPV